MSICFWVDACTSAKYKRATGCRGRLLGSEAERFSIVPPAIANIASALKNASWWSVIRRGRKIVGEDAAAEAGDFRAITIPILPVR